MEGGRRAISREPRVNERIRAREVRLIAADGQQLGVLPVREALRMAEEQGYDLVEVAPNASPPVCRMMDYGKYKYELKKQAMAGKKQKVQALKEVKLRPNIAEHDFAVKVNRVKGFLEKGHKAKIVVFFRGREIIHPEIGHELATKVVESVSDVGSIDSPPKLLGKNLIMILAPKKTS
ncbi:MAG TPA: translation initiation factor IF-3 [Thermodesulfobacteriota bacterium]|nr:translation initiation factor IF-3 [Thermodesulfobacteriota bacterium]